MHTCAACLFHLHCPRTDHYVAKLTGMLPEDPLTAALADQAYFFCEDVWQTL